MVTYSVGRMIFLMNDFKRIYDKTRYLVFEISRVVNISKPFKIISIILINEQMYIVWTL